MDWDLFLEIHKDMPRQGSGRNEYTQKAFEMIPPIEKPRILDIGCGPGMQTIHLANISNGTVIGIDIYQQFLHQLQDQINKEQLNNRVKAVNMSMMQLDFPKHSFDILWAEGSIFVIGFEKGLQEWKPFLKPKGYLAVHDIAWIKPNPPDEIRTYWKQEYPDIKTIKQHRYIIKRCNYHLIGYFPLPEDAWWEFYYHPLQQRLKTLKEKYKNNQKALELFKAEQREIDLYKKYHQWYGSVFYVMQKQE